MSALEQSLDAIISQNNKNRAPARRNPKGSLNNKSGKRVVASKKVINRPRAHANIRKPIPSGPRKASIPSVNPHSLDTATKVVVSGLPKDIKQNSVKDFFQIKIGLVQHVSLAYNERGRSTGVATVIFRKASDARKAVSSYNNAKLDNTNNRLKLELVVDTSNIPLSARIQPVRPNSAPSLKTKIQQQRKSRAAVVKGKPVRQQKKPVQKKVKKKTIEELDQEMADYFAKNEK